MVQMPFARSATSLLQSNTSFVRSATSFIEDNLILCPLKRNDVDREQSNGVLTTFVTILYSADTNTKNKSTSEEVLLFLVGHRGLEPRTNRL